MSDIKPLTFVGDRPIARQTTGELRKASPMDLLVNISLAYHFEHFVPYIREYMPAGVNGADARLMARMIIDAGDGDYCEVGVGHGANLIFVAKVREAFNIEGYIYGIDPFDARFSRQPKWICSIEQCQQHMDDWGVENVKLIQAAVPPWPEELKDNTFVCAMIDSDPIHKIAQLTYLELKDRVTGMLMLHNKKFRGIRETRRWAEMDGWGLKQNIGKSYLMERGDFKTWETPHGYPRYFGDSGIKTQFTPDDPNKPKEITGNDSE